MEVEEKSLLDALRLKEKANDAFKNSRYRRAIKDYKKALLLRPNFTQCWGNLSASYFELGSYDACIECIGTAVASFNVDQDARLALQDLEALKQKLGIRLSKALCHIGRRSPAIFRETIESYRDTLLSLRSCTESSSDAWWDVVDEIQLRCTDPKRATGCNLNSLPLRKSSADPSMEYWSMGHDDFHTILEGFRDGWIWPLKPKPLARATSDVDLRDLSKSELQELSFLFGGVGDARHVFATIVDIATQAKRLNPKSISAHLTLVDISPTMLARNLVLFHLLLSGPSPTIYEVLFYSITGYLVPSHVQKAIIVACQKVKKALSGEGNPLPDLIILDPALKPAVVDVLQYWISSNIQTLDVLNHIETFLESREEAFNNLDNYATKAVSAERELFRKIKVLLPPTDSPEAPYFEAGRSHVVNATIGLSSLPRCLGPSSLAPVHSRIKSTWKANPLFFDRTNEERDVLIWQGSNPDFLTQNPVSYILRGLRTLDVRIADDLSQKGIQTLSPSSSWFEIFVTRVQRSLQELSGRLKLELVLGDVVQFMSDLKQPGSLLDWRHGLPETFTRMWLSNVPDYSGGLLELALYSLPVMQNSPNACVGFNLYVNGPGHEWGEDVDSYCFTYTQLLPQQLPQFLRCSLVWDDHVEIEKLQFGACLVPDAARLTGDQLASREEVEAWLQRVLIRILSPPTLGQRTIYMPTTLRTFIQIFIHLHALGYPAHWHSEFISNLVLDKISTVHRRCARAPMDSKQGMAVHAPTRLYLSSRMADIEVTVACALSVLPFAIRLPANTLPAPSAIKTYRASVSGVVWRYKNFEGHWRPKCPAIAVMFLPPGVLRCQSPDLFQPATNEAQVVLSTFDMQLDMKDSISTFSLRLSEARIRKMRQQKWKFCFWRTDIEAQASQFSPMSKLYEIGFENDLHSLDLDLD